MARRFTKPAFRCAREIDSFREVGRADQAAFRYGCVNAALRKCRPKKTEFGTHIA